MSADGDYRPKKTEHAQRRQEEGRPVDKAMYDAQRARPSEVFIQPDGYWIVRGPNSREHIYKPNGDVLTSINERTNRQHQRLMRNGARRVVTDEEFARFKRFYP